MSKKYRMCSEAAMLSVTLAVLVAVVQSAPEVVKPNCALVKCAQPICLRGQTLYKPKNSCCHRCRPDIIIGDICALVKCARPFCPGGHELWTPPKKCCPTCRPKKVCVYDGKVYKNGQQFKDRCNTCTCRNGLVGCTKIGCLGCRYKGKSYKEGEKFKKNCNTCTCRRGKVSCTEKACTDKPGTCPKAWSFVSSCTKMCSSDSDCSGKMKCCRSGCSSFCRIPVGIVVGCKRKGIVYSEGQRVSPIKSCDRCRCVKGRIVCHGPICPMCMGYKPPGACCPKCGVPFPLAKA